MSNEATLRNRQYSWIVFGVDDKTHELIDTKYCVNNNFNHIKEKQKNDHFYFNRNGRFFVSLHCYDLIAYASLRLARVSTISSEAIRPRNLAQSSLLTKCTR